MHHGICVEFQPVGVAQEPKGGPFFPPSDCALPHPFPMICYDLQHFYFVCFNFPIRTICYELVVLKGPGVRL